MPIPGAATAIAGWSAGQARAAVFGDPVPDSRWEQPGATLVSARLCALIGRRRREARWIQGLEADLYQEVYADVWKRFDHIWETFLASRRPLRWNAFEAYLQSSIKHSLANAVRDQFPEPVAPADVPVPPPDPSSGSALDARSLLPAALAGLRADERDALFDQHLRGRSAEDTARRLGLKPASVYTLRHRGRERFHNAVIRLLGEEILRARGSSAMRAVVRTRCRDGHACYVFKLDCTKSTASPLQAAHGVDELARAIADALEESGLLSALDDCFWESRGSAAEDADHE